MIKSRHIFIELKELLPILQEKYKPEEHFFIALRLSDGQTAKVETTLKDLVATLFNIIDTNNNVHDNKTHPIWKCEDYKGRNLLSIFICDPTSQTVYDSNSYSLMPQKYKLRRDKDIRILQFTQLNEEEREQVVEMMAAQIEESLDSEKDVDETEEENNDNSNWGDMPWG